MSDRDDFITQDDIKALIDQEALSLSRSVRDAVGTIYQDLARLDRDLARLGRAVTDVREAVGDLERLLERNEVLRPEAPKGEAVDEW